MHFVKILRDACRNENITKLVLGSPGFYDLFGHVQGTAFDISSDAFATLRDLLTRHKPEVADFLINNYDVFFKHYLTMLTSENYVTKRQALKVILVVVVSTAEIYTLVFRSFHSFIRVLTHFC